MQLHTLPFAQTGAFSQLALDYLAGKKPLSDFAAHSFDEAGIADAIKQKQTFSQADRQRLVDALQHQYPADLRPADFQLEQLLDASTFTVTTAHQPNLFTGPAYFIYKIAGTIALCMRLNARFPDKKFVPVYWMGAEDHDLDELNHAHLFNQTLRFETNQQGAVGQMSLTDLKPVLDQLFTLLGEKAEAQQLKSWLEDSYRPDLSWAAATRRFVHHLFGSYGLLVVDGDDARLKAGFVPVMQAELEKQQALSLVQAAADRLEKAGYHAQIYPRSINLFWLAPGIRERIVEDVAGYALANGSKKWSKLALLTELHAHPENFSPNVVLRPLYQEACLPNVAFIGGGAEVAYWLLLKDVFELHNIPMPVIMLRASAQYIDRNSRQKMDKLGLRLADIFTEEETLVRQFVDSRESGLFSLDNEVEQLQHWFTTVADKIEKTDPSLKGAALAEGKKVEGLVRGLEARVKKAQKQKHETEINQIRQLKNKLMPGQHLQERHDNFMPVYLAEGNDFIDHCCKILDPLEKHFFILLAE